VIAGDCVEPCPISISRFDLNDYIVIFAAAPKGVVADRIGCTLIAAICNDVVESSAELVDDILEYHSALDESPG
jgi:hypothetical protein